jgi:hypothetical protein
LLIFNKKRTSKTKWKKYPPPPPNWGVLFCSGDGNKNPGPEGFNFHFFKHFWSLVSNEIRILFNQFLENAVLSKVIFSYSVVLSF